MLSRIIANSSRHLRSLSLNLSSHFHHPPSPSLSPLSAQTPKLFSTQFIIPRHFSTNNNNGGNDRKPSSDIWKITQENEDLEAVFGIEGGNLTGNEEVNGPEKLWADGESGVREESDGFEGVEKGFREKGGEVAADDWLRMEEYKPWNLREEEKVEDVFDIGVVGESGGSVDGVEEETVTEKKEDDLQLEKEEQALLSVLKGPNRAFGDLVAASGITDAMLDSLIALKNFQDIEGLPPLAEIEDMRYEKSLRKSVRSEMERQKQEEAAKARVRLVDEKGRSYGTGRRKCSIARVWIQPGDGKFLVNDKEFDVYFPMLDHRASLLRPFSETKTLGLWDIKCTVKGGGVSGQVGAIRLGISKALQNWEPGLRPQLREAGFLTRDPRVVERKKPGKAKARKSFQWVKR